MDKEKTAPGASDLTEGVIWKKLLGFFFPILFGMLFQQLYNTADAIVVGQFVGTTLFGTKKMRSAGNPALKSIWISPTLIASQFTPSSSAIFKI